MAEVATLVIEVLCGKILKAIGEVWTRSKQFKPLLKQLESTVERITPIFKDIASLNEDVHRPATETAVLSDQLEKGESLVLECTGARWWNKSSYAKKLIEYDGSLTRFFQIDVPAQILHSVRRVEGNLAGKPPVGWDAPDVLQTEAPKAPEKPKEPEKPKAPEAPKAPVYVYGAEHPLDFLRNSPQFQALLPLLKKNRDILKLTLQGLGKKHPYILEAIKDNKAEFLKLIYGHVDDDDKLIEDHKDLFEELINEPVDGSDGHLFYQHEQEMSHAINVSLAEQETPHTISVILAEQEAIERLEEMGFNSDLVIEAYLACDSNEELAVNYLLENAGYFEH